MSRSGCDRGSWTCFAPSWTRIHVRWPAQSWARVDWGKAGISAALGPVRTITGPVGNEPLFVAVDERGGSADPSSAVR